MAVNDRRVWRAAPATLAVVTAFALAAGVAVPLLAYLIYQQQERSVVPALLGVLTILALLYAWRFGLHPRLVAAETGVVVRNPFSRRRLDFDDITVIVPGENGLVIGTRDAEVEAWCVQKSKFSHRRGRRTRADAVAERLLDLIEEHDPPLEHPARGLRIRRGRPDESGLLAALERSASEAALAHVFPPERFPYPKVEVAQRWRTLLHDRLVSVRVLQLSEAAIGYVAFDADVIRHLGVVPDQTRRGHGSVLLEYATREIFDAGAQEVGVWVLTANRGARSFYRAHGWSGTDDRRECEFPPYPEELRLTKANPAAPRRSRAL